MVQPGDVVERYPDRTWHELNLSHADIAWLDPGPSRTVENVGETVVDFVEFELK